MNSRKIQNQEVEFRSRLLTETFPVATATTRVEDHGTSASKHGALQSR